SPASNGNNISKRAIILSQEKLNDKYYNHAKDHQQHITAYLSALQQSQLATTIIHSLTRTVHQSVYNVFVDNIFENTTQPVQWPYYNKIVKFIHVPFVLQHFSNTFCFPATIVAVDEPCSCDHYNHQHR